ncbi:MAG TPA: 30S ribosomal protein S12 methylthiotransferase RimO, partial [Coriobacteriia bacterium]|nr:30S ribosomal protein S12 methylthiotransferase RimO [Coriobacteriia bacterium]
MSTPKTGDAAEDPTSQAPSVAFLTLGCPKNEVDTDRMRAAIASSVFRLAEEAEDADVLVVNTCSFIQEA